jgi:hypothetical protein
MLASDPKSTLPDTKKPSSMPMKYSAAVSSEKKGARS